MTDVGRNETVRLDEDDESEFDGHSAFALMSFDHLESEVPDDHSSTHDHSIKTMPTPFERTNHDDVARTQADLMIQLTGEVDHYCLSTLLAGSRIKVTELDVAEIDDWIRASVLDVLLDTRRSCGIDLLIDGELGPFITTSQEDARPFVDLGWNRANVYDMARHRHVPLPRRGHRVPQRAL